MKFALEVVVRTFFTENLYYKTFPILEFNKTFRHAWAWLSQTEAPIYESNQGRKKIPLLRTNQDVVSLHTGVNFQAFQRFLRNFLFSSRATTYLLKNNLFVSLQGAGIFFSDLVAKKLRCLLLIIFRIAANKQHG